MASSSINYVDRSGNTNSKAGGVANKTTLAFDVKPNYTYSVNNPNQFIKIPPGEPATEPLDTIIDKLNRTVYLPDRNETYHSMLQTYSEYYNRYKVVNPNTGLQKGFAHVFFVRPSCNILDGGYKLLAQLVGNESFNHIAEASPWVLRELVANNGQNHDFMMLLSNYAKSFSLSDETMTTESYGKSYTGFKITIGKNINESRSSGQFSINFSDDRNLHVYQTLKAWVEYISGCYRGQIVPDGENIKNKILDYASSVYYILTAEDGETIVFWSKYYGVFPTDIPSSQLAWGAGNVVKNPEMDVQFVYSFKRDYSPYSLLEFNYNARVDNSTGEYAPIYDDNLLTASNNMVGSPFIETIRNTDGKIPIEFKLRFRPKPTPASEGRSITSGLGRSASRLSNTASNKYRKNKAKANNISKSQQKSRAASKTKRRRR